MLSEALNLTEPDSSARAHMLEQLARISERDGRSVETQILNLEALRIAELIGERELSARLRGRSEPAPRARSGVLTKSGREIAAIQTHPKVLIVEDEPPLARALERWLRRKGFAVTVCDSVAATLATSAKFNCGIFDVTLPDGSGLQLAELLMDEGRVASSVFFTSSEEAAVAAIAESLGALVRKSRGMLALVAVVDAAIKSVAEPTPVSPANRTKASRG